MPRSCICGTHKCHLDRVWVPCSWDTWIDGGVQRENHGNFIDMSLAAM